MTTYLVYAVYAIEKFEAEALTFIIVYNDFDVSHLAYRNAPGFHYFYPDSDDALKLVKIDYQPSSIKRTARHSALVRYVALNLKFNWRSIENLFKPSIDPSV